MADETQKQTVTLEELMVSSLAMSEATVKLLMPEVNFGMGLQHPKSMKKSYKRTDLPRRK
jgi:hypothetical protein